MVAKEPIQMFWVIMGLLFIIASVIGIERMVPRY